MPSRLSVPAYSEGGAESDGIAGFAPFWPDKLDHLGLRMWQSVRMAAERSMHNPGSPPAAESRAAQTYVLDLTSWCVKSGSVQLPLALLGRFGPGALVAQSDGGELQLEFSPPRTLGGFGDYFAAHGLRANDCLHFEFAADGLHVAAKRRERGRHSAGQPRPVPAAGVRAGATPLPAAPPAQPDPRRRASDWADAIDREVAQAAAARRDPAPDVGRPVPAIKVERFAGAVEELAPGRPQRRRRDDPAPERTAARAPADPVVRIRIEGGIPAQPGTGDVRPKDRLSAHNVWARRENPQWHSLDPVRAANAPEGAQDPDFPDTVVRAYRRSANGTVRAEPLSPPTPSAAPERSGAGATRDSRPVAPRPAAGVSPAPVVGSSARPNPGASLPGLRNDVPPAPAVPVPGAANLAARGDRAEAAPEVDVESAVESLPTFGSLHDEPTRPPARGARLGVMSRLGLRLGIGRERAAARGGGALTPDDPSTFGPRLSQDQRSRGAPGVSAGPQAAAIPAPRLDRSGEVHLADGGRVPVARRRAPAPTAAVQAALIDPEAEVLRGLGATRDGAEAPGERAVEAPAPTASVEDDVAFLEGYLLRPGTPAIVRSLDLAERLGISPERVTRAMERLSEQRERFSRIQHGAYMVRQKRA